MANESHHDGAPAASPEERRRERVRGLRRRRLRRHSRRAYIRSVQFLPSLATLGNAICGFGAIYVAGLSPEDLAGTVERDPMATYLAEHRFFAACFLIVAAMVFDALDGRLARFARHTTDFGGQLDSLADAISFGAAPAFIALQVFKFDGVDVPLAVSRFIWAAGAFYVACTLLRLARFNVSNEHGEQHHMSFLGLPSPGAAAGVIALVLIQQELGRGGEAGAALAAFDGTLRGVLVGVVTLTLPLALLLFGGLMVSTWRYTHPVNKYLRGGKSLGGIVAAAVVLVLVVTFPIYTLSLVSLVFVFSGVATGAWARFKLRRAESAEPTA